MGTEEWYGRGDRMARDGWDGKGMKGRGNERGVEWMRKERVK